MPKQQQCFWRMLPSLQESMFRHFRNIPERMGAPVTVYNRIDDKNIRVHSNIYQPDYSIVVDESLLEVVNVTAGLKSTGAVIVNTNKSKEEIIPHLHGYEGKLYTIDARKVSMETLENISRIHRCWQRL